MKNAVQQPFSVGHTRSTCVKLRSGFGATITWDPAADDHQAGVVGWDLLAGADSVSAADRIAEGLLSVAGDSASIAYRPEAELLCADLLRAGAQGKHRFETVLDWIDARDVAPAHRVLAATGDQNPADDIDWFTYAAPTEQHHAWQILTHALQPLRDPKVLACLQPGPDSTYLPGPLRTLFAREPLPQPCQLLVAAEQATRGVAAALIDRLLRAIHEHDVGFQAYRRDEHDAS